MIMLVLSRKAGQRVQIGDSITLSVLGVRGQRIRLGIQAPREVVVQRQEILSEPARENPSPGVAHDQRRPGSANGHSIIVNATEPSGPLGAAGPAASS
jgi:carbon storage regulator